MSFTERANAGGFVLFMLVIGLPLIVITSVVWVPCWCVGWALEKLGVEV